MVGRTTIKKKDLEQIVYYKEQDLIKKSIIKVHFPHDIVISGSLTVSDFIKATKITGSITQLFDGTSYLVAGSNITIVSASNGSVIISSVTGSGGRQWIDVGPNHLATTGAVSLSGSDSTLTIGDGTGNPSLYYNKGTGGETSGAGYFSTGTIDWIAFYYDSGADLSIQRYNGGAFVNSPILFSNIGSTTIFGDTTIRPQTNIVTSLGTPSLRWSDFHAQSGTLVGNFRASIITASLGFTGSLTRLVSGQPYLLAGTNITITTGSDGQITITGSGSIENLSQTLAAGNTTGLNPIIVSSGSRISFAESDGDIRWLTRYNSVSQSLDNVYLNTSGVELGTILSLSESRSFLSNSLLIGKPAGPIFDIFSASVEGTIFLNSSGSDRFPSINFTNNGELFGRILGSYTSSSFAAMYFYLNDTAAFFAITGTAVDPLVGTLYPIYAYAGVSGSLTRLTDGSSYLRNGSNIEITTGSTGFVSVALSSNVSISTLTASVGITVQEARLNNALFLSGILTSTGTLNTTENNYTQTGFASCNVLRLLAHSSNSSLTGLAGGAAGRTVLVVNISGTGSILITHEGTGSTAANRFISLNNTTHTMRPNTSAWIWYDGIDSRWRINN